MPIAYEPVPKTLVDAIAQLQGGLTDEERDFIRSDDFPAAAHHSVGRGLRNTWGLWDDKSALYKHFKDAYGITHADDMSGMILKGLKASVMGTPWRAEEAAQKYRAYWENQ